ncbi:MAG: pyridoxal phosphate-dependent aminotransferase [Deltaproteobacteria bacterium]|nr:pyridoxal phosphate-dependent aminotransferase [Deltaproteobacteria bacterium]MBW2445289.1 pyridoxal phosphate-dependent aminotransferase [Deltaproteobacteria bacterium]
MPRTPERAPTVDAIPAAIFSPLADRIRSHEGKIFPLHVGDTWMEPFAGGRMEAFAVADHPGMHRYVDTQGIPPLVDGLVGKLRSRNGLACEPDEVLATGGATGALAAAVGSIAAPGEEVLILSPFWPLIRGIVQSFRAVPVEVPFYDRVGSAAEAVAAVRARMSGRTVALYVSTPSNPTGCVMPGDWLEALASFARSEGLWILSDEVYEDYVYEGEHVSIGRFAPERTFSVFSFSKAYGMAGNRVGYLAGPKEAVAAARKVGTHTVYHPPTAGQLAAVAALESGAAWVGDARAAYQRVGVAAAAALGLAPPAGGTFLFVDVAGQLDERGLWGFLEDCLDDGVLLAPGPACGADYPTWVRLCFTAAPPADVEEAVTCLARRLAAG